MNRRLLALSLLEIATVIFFRDLLSLPTDLCLLKLLVMVCVYLVIFVALLAILYAIGQSPKNNYNRFEKVSVCISLLITIMSITKFQEISVAKDILYFRMNAELFNQIVEIGTGSQCYQSGSVCLEYAEDAVQNTDIFVLSSSINRRVIGTNSREAATFIYYDSTEPLNKSEKIGQAYIDCFITLENHWFICEIRSGN